MVSEMAFVLESECNPIDWFVVGQWALHLQRPRISAKFGSNQLFHTSDLSHPLPYAFCISFKVNPTLGRLGGSPTTPRPTRDRGNLTWVVPFNNSLPFRHLIFTSFKKISTQYNTLTIFYYYLNKIIHHNKIFFFIFSYKLSHFISHQSLFTFTQQKYFLIRGGEEREEKLLNRASFAYHFTCRF